MEEEKKEIRIKLSTAILIVLILFIIIISIGITIYKLSSENNNNNIELHTNADMLDDNNILASKDESIDENEKDVKELTDGDLGTYDKEKGWITVEDAYGVMRYNEIDDDFDITAITSGSF